MINPTENLYILIGSIGAALIAALFTFINLVSTKEAKISEFRQKWIDDLRADIANFVSKMDLVLALSKEGKYLTQNAANLTSDDLDELNRLREQCTAHFTDAKRSYTFIQLRINKIESDEEAKTINKEFLAALKKTNINPVHSDAREYSGHLDDLVDKASALLKMEWKRVKMGEKGHVRAIRLAIGIITSVVAGLLYVIYSPNVVFNSSASQTTDITARIKPQKIELQIADSVQLSPNQTPQPDESKKKSNSLNYLIFSHDVFKELQFVKKYSD